MSGKPNVWTPDRDTWLIKCVAAQVKATGGPQWVAISAAGDITPDAARVRYSTLIQAGRAPRVTAMIAGVPAVVTPPPQRDQEVETKTTESGIESRSNGRTIKTVDDLLRYIKADMTRFEIDKSEATKWDGHSKDESGNVVVTELHRVFVRLKPKAGPDTLELVGSVIDAAFATRKRLPLPRRPQIKSLDLDLLEVMVIPEAHVGKLAWSPETGHGDYDTTIATTLIRRAAAQLMAASRHRRPAERIIVSLGDFFHFDSMSGQTTKGTPLDRDSRAQKMIDAGARLFFDIVESSAGDCPTRVLLVPGNHDEVLTWALQRILLSHFRHDDRVTVDPEYTSRKYVTWGQTLLGFCHGDKAKVKQLPSLMSIERKQEWGASTYREIHSGHTHALASIQTLDGVVTRVCPSISAPDKWHAENGYVGAPRTMESYFYSARGRLVAMESSDAREAA